MKIKKVYAIIERYCLTGVDENYEGRLIKEMRVREKNAKMRAKELKKTARIEGQDKTYEVEEHELKW